MDWGEVHRRIGASMRQERSEEEVARILGVRARKLASGKWKEESSLVECIEFAASSNSFVIEMEHVREICQLDAITPLPCTPDFVLGVSNVRGEIVSVLDILVLVGMQPETEDHDRLIVLDAGDLRFGLAADFILGAKYIRRDEIHPSQSCKFLYGMLGRAMVIDAGRLMKDPGIIVKEDVDYR